MNKNEFLEHFFKLNLCNFTANSQMFSDKDLNVIVTKDDNNHPQTAVIELFMENDLKLSIILDVSRPEYEYETSNSFAALSCFFIINQRHIAKTTKNRNKGVVLIYSFLKTNQFLV